MRFFGLLMLLGGGYLAYAIGVKGEKPADLLAQARQFFAPAPQGGG